MSTATLSPVSLVDSVLASIAEAVERVRNDELQHFSVAASPGDALRQGDVVVQFLGDNNIEIPPHIYAKLDTPVLQLAPGTSKGSRHVLAHATGVEMWEPVVGAYEIARFVYERAGKKMPPPGSTSEWQLEFREVRDQITSSMMLAGPIFRLTEPNELTHPEHGNWSLPPGTYRVIFQRTLDTQQRIARVID